MPTSYCIFQCIHHMILPEDPLDDRTLEDVATALHHAINNGHVDTALVLIDAGADLELKDAQGRTPRELAKQKQQTGVLSYLQHGPRKNIYKKR